MEVIEAILTAARNARPHIVLSEGEDERVVRAGARAIQDGLASISVVADPDKFRAVARGVDGADRINVCDPATSPLLEDYAETYYLKRRHKGVDESAAREAMHNCLNFAAMMVHRGDADGTIGGAVYTTADTVRAALHIIGKAADIDVVSSFFLMLLPEPFDRPVVFADCGLILQPTDQELASIAIESAASLQALVGQEPRVAMLSFSTVGSVPKEAHESLDRIERAMGMIRQRSPDLIVDGEIQFDAAIVPKVANKKAPDSALGGEANVFVFPSLSAGNIGYKIAHRLGGAVALGPILQGLAHPANDLSRGCSSEDIYRMIGITGAQTVINPSVET